MRVIGKPRCHIAAGPWPASAKAGNTKWLKEACSRGRCYSKAVFEPFGNTDPFQKVL
ncbi:MAG: hypothetical protein KBT49_00180 [Bacteroidetes bacterium]|nr:hypothetical protein [Candidatus Colenecus caballi]